MTCRVPNMTEHMAACRIVSPPQTCSLYNLALVLLVQARDHPHALWLDIEAHTKIATYPPDAEASLVARMRRNLRARVTAATRHCVSWPRRDDSFRNQLNLIRPRRLDSRKREAKLELCTRTRRPDTPSSLGRSFHSLLRATHGHRANATNV